MFVLVFVMSFLNHAKDVLQGFLCVCVCFFSSVGVWSEKPARDAL